MKERNGQRCKQDIVWFTDAEITAVVTLDEEVGKVEARSAACTEFHISVHAGVHESESPFTL